MKNRFSIFAALVLLAGFAGGCTRPVKDYSYRNLDRLRGWESGPVELEFEIKESQSPCEIYLVGEIAVKRTIDRKRGYPVEIILTSPDSLKYRDTLTLPLHIVRDKDITRTSNGIREIEWPYRKNIVHPQSGKWKIEFRKTDPSTDYSEIIGLGIHCKQD